VPFSAAGRKLIAEASRRRPGQRPAAALSRDQRRRWNLLPVAPTASLLRMRRIYRKCGSGRLIKQTAIERVQKVNYFIIDK